MLGLRERKKNKNKIVIQEQALKLFLKQGYVATTIEQIAEAAEISPSTFFRYFKTKESVMLYDSLDPLIIQVFKEQPSNLNVIQALRSAIKEVFTNLPRERMSLEMRRGELIRSVPELRAGLFDELVRNIDMFAEMIAERTGRKASELAVRNLAGAIIGVVMASLLQVYQQKSSVDYVQTFDAALAQLEKDLASSSLIA